jgi:hypothetical protein
MTAVLGTHRSEGAASVDSFAPGMIPVLGAHRSEGAASVGL